MINDEVVDLTENRLCNNFEKSIGHWAKMKLPCISHSLVRMILICRYFHWYNITLYLDTKILLSPWVEQMLWEFITEPSNSCKCTYFVRLQYIVTFLPSSFLIPTVRSKIYSYYNFTTVVNSWKWMFPPAVTIV